MKIAIYIGKEELKSDAGYQKMISDLTEGKCSVYELHKGVGLQEDTDMVLSVGGDGTFLSVATVIGDSGVPVLGVNMGRLGFLSENRPQDIVQAVLSGEYTIEDRKILQASLSEPTGNPAVDSWPYALNEVSVHRAGAAMLGVDVSVDGVELPTYWADGLLVATSSGSTAYSLSVGGPIVLPEAKVLIISPIASHNLNVRPMVVPADSKISLRLHSRDGKAVFTADNRTAEIPENTDINIAVAQFSLKRVRLNKSNFIKALTEKLFWGEDVRNIK